MASGFFVRSPTRIPPESSRESFQDLIQRYFIQLTTGCGRKGECDNQLCATGSGRSVAPNAAAAKALLLARQRSPLCVAPLKVENSNSKTQLTEYSTNHMSNHDTNSVGHSNSSPSSRHAAGGESENRTVHSSQTDSNSTLRSSLNYPYPTVTTSSSATANQEVEAMDTSSPPPPPTSSTTSFVQQSSSSESQQQSLSPPITDAIAALLELTKNPIPTVDSDLQGLTESQVMALLQTAEANGGDYRELSNCLWTTFSSPEALNRSFLLESNGGKLESCIPVDIPAVRRVYAELFSCNVDAITNTLTNVMETYCTAFKRQSRFRNKEPLNHVVILFENPMLHSPEFLEHAFPKFLFMLTNLSFSQKVQLVEWYSSYSVEDLQRLISILHQMILVQLISSDEDAHYNPHSDKAVVGATQAMMIFCIANLLIARRQGKMRPHSELLLSAVAKPMPDFLQSANFNDYERLLLKFEVHPSELLQAPIPLEEFLNEELNNRLNLLTDYRRHGRMSTEQHRSFSFLDHPFVLTPANKVEKLFFDNQLSMINERHRTMLNTVLTGTPDLPFLLLRIDRHELVADTLVQLEAIAEMNPTDLRKQLRVEFKGEEGIDEGGLQKEFFQLLVERLFDPMNGMFLLDEDLGHHWFNQSSFESEEQYHLIGILLGLAIYNNIILDIHFPLVVYQKLIGCRTVLMDLHSTHPQIASSLKSLLEMKEEEEKNGISASRIEETFMATFTASYTDMFSIVQTVPLKDGGENIPVTSENCTEYVDLYLDWLLNKSIAKQFNAFKKGFDLVMGESNLADLFTAREVELLICGDQEWDFDALEENTSYDGFKLDDDVIKNFWEIFYEFTDEQKKQLLAFVTGSDRVPVGGLSKMKIIIVKNGPDSDRLPTAHTCFNALLLCNYSSKGKLRERLLKALSHGKGFGML